MKQLVTALLLITSIVTAQLAAQERDAELSEDLQRLVSEGKAAELETRLRGGRTAEEKHLIAQAYANKARRARDARDRKRAFEKADEKYRLWIDTLERAARRGRLTDRVRLAAGRVQYAGMILSGRAANDLDEFEISLGRRGDRKLLEKLLKAALQLYEQAGREIPSSVDLSKDEEEDLLAAGLYDTLRSTRLDLMLNTGWANYYLGVLAKKEKRGEYLAAAEREFQELINSGQTGQMHYLCYLALAMTQREEGRFKDAEDSFRYALEDDVEWTTEARIRYELARCQIKAGKFDEARTTLRPLAEKDLRHLSAADRPARFYINLAHLWYANSYLVEAEVVRRQARGSMSETAILQKARLSREKGLSRMNRLAGQGGPWPALVRIYVAKSVNLRRSLRELSVMELVFTAGMQTDAKRYKDALKRLEEASSREGLSANLAADVLFETGRCQFQLRREREAALAFQKLAAEHREHAKAPQAATLAYQLWGKIAERSKRPEDYLQLAATLRNLIVSFADHPDREEAVWLLPLSLQLAQRFDEAAEQFAKVPAGTENWEEARYRRVICGRKAVEAARESLGVDEYRAKGKQAAEELTRYADEALARSASALSSEAVLKWSAQARLTAGELLLSQGVEDHQRALQCVEAFETKYPDSELAGRAWAVRIRAYCGLREFQHAAEMLNQFLETAAPAQIGGTLAALAKGMQDEVERLLEDGQTDTARKLATDSIAAFEELEKWVRADPRRAQNLGFVLSGRARMQYLAGQYEEARRIVAELLEQDPKNGNYQQLRALILTARLPADAAPDQLKEVQEAWAVLLTDPAIRTYAPQRYWEARYNWLALALRLGNAADVEQAITQERVWYPDLGGTPWQEKLAGLLAEARAAQGKPPETQRGVQPQQNED
ncbi:MAG: tetratricopeptide repeat protein [Phycisphaerae bacterium]|nr:tetratricopeptide repeat protein [Phycisphaerae bacterium]